MKKQNDVTLTSFTDYGLRMLMRMARAPDQAFSTADLVEECKLSNNHLTKIMQRLAQGGVVEIRRGVNDGAVLRSSRAEIRFGDAVRLPEQEQPPVECFGPDGGDRSIDRCSRLKARLRRAEGRFIEDLNRSILVDIALPQQAAA